MYVCVCVQGCNIKCISYNWFMTSPHPPKKRKREKENITLQDVEELHPPQKSVKWQRNVDLNSSNFHLLIESSNQTCWNIISVIY